MPSLLGLNGHRLPFQRRKSHPLPSKQAEEIILRGNQGTQPYKNEGIWLLSGRERERAGRGVGGEEENGRKGEAKSLAFRLIDRNLDGEKHRNEDEQGGRG